MAKKLKNVTDEELKQELIAREADRRAALNTLRKINAEFVLQHVDVLLAAVPNHECTSCSDDNPTNYYEDHGRPRCKRCALLRIKKDEFNSGLTLDIELRYTEELDNTPDNLRVWVQERT